MRMFSYNMTKTILRAKMIFIFFFFANGVIAQKNIAFLEKIQAYQDSVKLIMTGEFPDQIDTSTFNINNYFRFFDNLSLPTDSKLQYIFCDDKLSGNPILFVKKDSIKMENYWKRKFGEYIKQYNLDKNNINQEFINSMKNEILCRFAATFNARKFIIPEDSEVGYLQFLFFNQFGEQFALKWHSNYGQKSVIFSKSEMGRHFNYYSGTDLFSCDLEKFKTLLRINPKPKIKMKKDNCLITWYEIATHSGIYKRTYEIKRSTPYSIEKIEDIKILKINREFIY